MILKLNVDGSVERVECSDESVWNVCRKELDGGFLECLTASSGKRCRSTKKNPPTCRKAR